MGDLQFSTLPVEQAEGPQRGPRRHIREVGISGALRIHAADAGDAGKNTVCTLGAIAPFMPAICIS